MTDQPLEPDEQPTRVRPEPPPPQPSGLYRSRDDRVIGGVCGGLAQYFRIDPVLMRIAFVLLVFAGGLGILAYVLGWIFIPEEPPGAPGSPVPPADDTSAERSGPALALGLVFVALGVIFLLDFAWPDFLSWRYIWPIALIAVGAAIVLRNRR